MTRSTRWSALALACAALAWSSPAAAQSDYTFRVAALGGLGGSADSDLDNDLDHDAFQLEFGMVTNQATLATIRVGRIALDGDQPFDGLLDAQLEYANIAGEYRFDQGYYDYGIYLGLGAYKLGGDRVGGGDESQTALGVAFGINGDFDVTRHLAVTAGASAHYAFFDKRSNLYINGLVGLALRF